MNASGLHWLDVRTPQGIQAVAFAADFALWSLGILLVIYLSWLPTRRESPETPSLPVTSGLT